MSIYFNSLGNNGRLGNQMFQYASLKGIAAKHGYDYYIPPASYFGVTDESVNRSDYDLHRCFDIKNIGVNTMVSRVLEKSFNFDDELFNTCPDNINLEGYFQSDKYFNHIEKELRTDFNFNRDILDGCLKVLQHDNDFMEDYISLHVRRGDYVNNQNHYSLDMLYYFEALKHFSIGTNVIVFSDDIEWCKNQELFQSTRFIFSENNSTVQDLCLMSLCKYHIIANSSFSWWGSWLADSEKTIAPKNWFDGNLSNYDTKDLYRKQWIII